MKRSWHTRLVSAYERHMIGKRPYTLTIQGKQYRAYRAHTLAGAVLLLAQHGYRVSKQQLRDALQHRQRIVGVWDISKR